MTATIGLCTIGREGVERVGVLAAGRVTDLADLAALTAGPAPPATMRELFAAWDHWCEVARTALTDPAGLSVDPSEVTFLPPVADPSAIYCAGANYHDHAREMGGPPPDRTTSALFHFLAAPAALTGHRCPVRRPMGCTRLDWEVELVVVMGRRASGIDPGEVPAHVAGYTIANDVSARDYAGRSEAPLGVDWLRHKSFATLLPVGPAIVPSRDVVDPMNLGLRLSVNGAVRQRSTTSQMIYPIQEQIAALSAVLPLAPGDLVLTGTPAGTAAAHGHYLEPGDVMVAEIDGLGRLENPVV